MTGHFQAGNCVSHPFFSERQPFAPEVLVRPAQRHENVAAAQAADLIVSKPDIGQLAIRERLDLVQRAAQLQRLLPLGHDVLECLGDAAADRQAGSVARPR